MQSQREFFLWTWVHTTTTGNAEDGVANAGVTTLIVRPIKSQCRPSGSVPSRKLTVLAVGENILVEGIRNIIYGVVGQTRRNG
jgi:hypothetical protein